MIDSHAHLNFRAFKNDVEKVVVAAQNSGITEIIVPGAKIESSRKAIELARQFRIIHAAVGFHPHHIKEYNSNTPETLRELAHGKDVVAIGECGLDYYQYGSTKDYPLRKEAQRKLLNEQLNLALERSLPIIIHCRDAWQDIFPIVSSFKEIRGVFHCWTGNLTDIKKALNLNFYISFSGLVTYKTSKDIQECARYVPIEKLLVETDSPFLSPEGLRHLRNEPKNVRIVAEHLACIKQVSFEQIVRNSTKNAKNLFRL